MKRIHGISPVPPMKWPVVTLGTFDGVHLGHQAVLDETVSWAHEQGGEAVVLTFATHPRAITSGESARFITSLKHRLLLMERRGIDAAFILDFDRKLAAMPAEEFVQKYLVEAIGARGVVMGYNNRFGREGKGDADLLRTLGRDAGFEVRQPGPVAVNGSPVSSTAIRQAICTGDLQLAQRMLGRRVSVLGTVISGEGRGRKLGFPTANLDLHHEAHPPAGLYAGQTTLEGRRWHALVSIGNQPTFHAPAAPVIVEVYIVDYSGNLYGQEMEVHFLARLRDQLQFDSADELIAQMNADVEEARKIPLDPPSRWST